MMKKEQEKIPKDLLRPNQRLEILLMDGSTETYQSRIEEVGEDRLTLAMPMSKGRPILLYEGSSFNGRMPCHGGMYVFASTFLDKAITPLPVWVVSLPRDVRKVQQRSFVRVSARVETNITYVEPPAPGSAQAPTARTLQLETKDISGGGVGLISKVPLKHGQKVRLQLYLPVDGAENRLELLGSVSRCERPQADLPVFWLGIRYEDIQEADRQKIIRYVFKKQLEERQKGIR